jgi:predicted ester cyclase
MSEQNKEIVRRWQDAYNGGNLDVLDEVLAPDWVSNSWPDGVPHTIEGAKDLHRWTLSLWPDWHFTTEELIAERDLVVQRFTCTGTHDTGVFVDVVPNGNRFSAGGTSIFRIRDGRIVEHWTFFGELEFLQQLGAQVPEDWLASTSHLNRTKPAVELDVG